MSDGYSKAQIGLHWGIVGLVAIQFAVHEPIVDAFEVVETGGTPILSPLVGLHIFCGFMVFALMLVRLQLRVSQGTPPPPEGEPKVFQTLGNLAHWAFYALLVALPISGAVAWFRSNEAAADAHEVMRGILFVLIALHIAAALVHQFVWKTNLMARMTRPKAE
ncbi:MAG: cytochrome b/b6 domain-containing protein [Paracoccaceae bacterium]|nr:cytochrome b/b6 domain-containing protein [Paracoccaceae bacterium]